MIVVSLYCGAQPFLVNSEPLMHSHFSRVWHALVLWAALVAPVHAQTIDDGIMLAKHELLTGNYYSHDSWDEYWEGALKRDQWQHRNHHDQDQCLVRQLRPHRIG